MSTTQSIQNTVELQETLRAEVQRQHYKNAVMTNFANRQYEGELKRAGDSVRIQEFPILAGNRTNSAGAGDDITARTFATAEHKVTVDQVVNDAVKIPDLEELRTNFNEQQEVAGGFAYWIAQCHERHIGLIASKNAGTTINSASPVALTNSNVVTQLRKFATALRQKNIDTRQAALFVDPLMMDLIDESDKFQNCDKGIEMLQDGVKVEVKTGFTNKSLNGVRVYETNNLPFAQSFTLDTNPTADDTITIEVTNDEAKSGEAATTTITWTFKATAAAAGEITIGANAAATQTNIIAAFLGANRSGTAASGYVDVATASRKLLDNAELECSAFASDVATVRANNFVTLGETFTAGTNVFGTAAVVAMAWTPKGVNFVDQLTKLKVTDAEKGFYGNVLYESTFQAAVLGRQADAVVAGEFQQLSL